MRIAPVSRLEREEARREWLAAVEVPAQERAVREDARGEVKRSGRIFRRPERRSEILRGEAELRSKRGFPRPRAIRPGHPPAQRAKETR